MRPAEYVFRDDLLSFTQKSLEWCRGEADEAARNVANAIQILSEEANRIVDMSQESSIIVQNLTKQINDIVEEQASKVIIKDLIEILADITKEHNDIEGIINPIIEALQFQDRLSQNFQNQIKMINKWMVCREKVAKRGQFSGEDATTFGMNLADCTTMAEERAVIKKHIPTLTFKEVSRDDVGLF